MKTAICIASGPSLTQDDVDYCRGKGAVYVVKECHHMAPWADVLYAADVCWWVNNLSWKDFKGAKWTCGDRAVQLFPELNYIEAKCQWFWSTERGKIATGGNSGFQIINMAALDGAERIILLGYDYGHEASGQKHWWDDEYPRDSRPSNYEEWNKKLEKAAKYIEIPVINASRESAITCFPRTTIQEAV